MGKVARRKKIHHGDAGTGDRENRRKCNRGKGLRHIEHWRGESSGDTKTPRAERFGKIQNRKVRVNVHCRRRQWHPAPGVE